MIDEKEIKIGKTIDEFVDYIKNFELPKNYKEIYIQFESWLDKEIETPKILYHVCRTIDVNDIKRYGIYPKSKHKISYHPDRIYLVSNLSDVEIIIKQFEEKDKQNNLNIEYSVVKIEKDKNKDTKYYNLLVRKDPNFNEGFYTTQNILSCWISDIIKM